MKFINLLLNLAEQIVEEIEPQVYDVYTSQYVENGIVSPLLLKKIRLQNVIRDYLQRFPNLSPKLTQFVQETVSQNEEKIANIYTQFYIQGGDLSVRELQRRELQKLVKCIILHLEPHYK